MGFSIWRRYVIAPHDSPGFAAVQPVQCTGLVHVLAVGLMGIDMKMIVMEAGRKIEVIMAMAEKENGAIEMMIGIVERGSVMVKITRNAIEEVTIGMTSTVEEVLMMTNMAQEARALTEIMIIMLMMMVSVHLGMCLR